MDTLSDHHLTDYMEPPIPPIHCMKDRALFLWSRGFLGYKHVSCMPVIASHEFNELMIKKVHCICSHTLYSRG